MNRYLRTTTSLHFYELHLPRDMRIMMIFCEIGRLSLVKTALGEMNWIEHTRWLLFTPIIFLPLIVKRLFWLFTPNISSASFANFMAAQICKFLWIFSLKSFAFAGLRSADFSLDLRCQNLIQTELASLARWDLFKHFSIHFSSNYLVFSCG